MRKFLVAFVVILSAMAMLAPDTVHAALSTAAERTLSLMINSSGQLVLLPFTGSPAPALSTAGNGTIYFDSTANTFLISQNAGAYVNFGNATPAGVFSTSVTTPIVYGGTAAGSTISIRGTSNGSPSNAYVNLSPSREGNVSIGNTSSPLFADSGSMALSISAAVANPSFALLELATGNVTNTAGVGRISFVSTASSTARGSLIDVLQDTSNGLYGHKIRIFATDAGGALSNVMVIKQSTVGIGAPAPLNPTNLLSFDGQAARKFWMERNTTSNTAGNSLTIQAGGATSGATDKAGGNLLLYAGASTGLGTGYTSVQGYFPADSTGTADNTLVDRQIVGAYKALTNASPTSILNMTIASNTAVASLFRYAVQVFNGTDVQVEEGTYVCHATNKAASIANNTCLKAGNQQATTSGTLTVTFTITAASPAVVQVNANSSLTPNAGYPRLTYTVDNLTSQAIAVQ